MKLIMILGGLLGFGIGLVFSWAQGSPWPSVVWRASVAAFVAGVLMRWWGRIWISALRETYREKQSALSKVESKSAANAAQ